MADQESPFSQDAVPVNQSGRLTDQQAQLWARIAKRRRQSVRGVALPFAAIGAILLFANGSGQSERCRGFSRNRGNPRRRSESGASQCRRA